ncbi:hypothetical protein MIZ03_2193 [Rhodoferax lithotrophicus]|uniref:Uncharacterized protein n=1 Tax=Rhodoferax lithotrophicus TaxID=2798804 RepID=A0ABN6D5L8_9BURK|nr:hypothetical protein MIZ03_2193 [Rhodoferax sp. MIZ03]
MQARIFNDLMGQVPRLTLRQRDQLKKRLDDQDAQQQGDCDHRVTNCDTNTLLPTLP